LSKDRTGQFASRFDPNLAQTDEEERPARSNTRTPRRRRKKEKNGFC